jgi:hypothetical protein
VLGLADGLVVALDGEVGVGDTATDPADGADVAGADVGTFRPRLKLGSG